MTSTQEIPRSGKKNPQDSRETQWRSRSFVRHRTRCHRCRGTGESRGTGPVGQILVRRSRTSLLFLSLPPWGRGTLVWWFCSTVDDVSCWRCDANELSEVVNTLWNLSANLLEDSFYSRASCSLPREELHYGPSEWLILFALYPCALNTHCFSKLKIWHPSLA